MIEIIEIIWKHSEAPPLADSKGAPTSAEKTTDDDDDGDVSKPPTVDVGGASFSVTKLLAIDDEIDDGRLGAGSSASMLLVARGVSHLSYFYVGVVSSVLYLDPASTNNDAVLFRDVDIDEGHHDNDGRQRRRDDDHHRTPMALEIHYHVPARASDLRWATRRLAEANLPGAHRGKKIDGLPRNVRRGVRDFVNMYRDVRPGDRYTLSYVPGRGLSLSLNDVRLGTIGIGMGGGGNDDDDDDDDDDGPRGTTDGGGEEEEREEEEEERELARIVYGVWFGADAPFSVPMRNELLTTPAMLRLPSHGRGATKTTTTTTTEEEAAGAAPPDPPITSSGDATFGHTAGTTTIVALVAIALSLWSRRGGRRGVSSPIVIGSCGETRIKTLQRVVGGVEQQHWHRR